MKTDIHTEREVLIAMLNSELACQEGMGLLTPELFGHEQYGKLFKIMRQMFNNSEPVNIITVAPHIRNINSVELKDLMQPMISSKQSIAYLIDRMKDYSQGRKAVEIMSKAINRIEYEPSQEVVNEATEKLFSMAIVKSEEALLPGTELAVRALQHVSDRMDADKRKEKVIFTSFVKLNRITGGFEAGQLVILSGKTKSGKSAFCQNLMSAISVKQTIPCLYVNSEMSEEQMGLRWAAMLTGDLEITHSKLRSGDITSEQYSKVADGIERLYKSQFNCLTMPDLRIDKVIQVLRRYTVKHRIRAAAVDYIGRMDMVSGKSDVKDWQLLLDAARKLKTIAQQLGIVIFMVAQLTDTGTLQQARYMENECDLHLVIKKMDESEVADRLSKCEPWNYRLIVANARSCETGSEMLMQFNGEKLTFYGEA